MLRSFFIGVFTLLVSTGAIAQQKDSHYLAAEKLLTAMNLEESFNATLETSFEAASKTMAQNLQQPFIKAMKEFSVTYLKWDAIKPKLVDLYKNEFTESELNSLTKFYETPIGKKVMQKMPVLSAKGMEIGQGMVLEHQTELQKIMEKHMQE